MAPTRHVDWPSAWRIISTRYPPIDLFERVSPNPTIWEALIAAEQRVNPRVRDEIGQIALVAPEERISGPGASYVMASFTHLNPKGSRFSDGGFGVYYAARALETAIAETVHHFERFAEDSADPPRSEDMRVIVGAVKAPLVDVGALPGPERASLLDPDAYGAAQAFARTQREAGEKGLVYPSVRHPGGECIGASPPASFRRPGRNATCNTGGTANGWTNITTTSAKTEFRDRAPHPKSVSTTGTTTPAARRPISSFFSLL